MGVVLDVIVSRFGLRRCGGGALVRLVGQMSSTASSVFTGGIGWGVGSVTGSMGVTGVTAAGVSGFGAEPAL